MTKRPACEACNRRPRDMAKHVKTGEHAVKQYAADMKAQGWARVSGAHAVIHSIDPLLLRRGPTAVATKGPNNEVQMVEGFWAPTWAVRIAQRFDVKPSIRKQWLQQLNADPDLQLAFLGFLMLEGCPLNFFGVRQRDLAPGYLLGTGGIERVRGDRILPRDVDIWRAAPP